MMRCFKDKTLLLLLAVGCLAQVLSYLMYPASYGPDGIMYSRVAQAFLDPSLPPLNVTYDRFFAHPLLAYGISKLFQSAVAWIIIQQIVYVCLLIPSHCILRKTLGKTLGTFICLFLAIHLPMIASQRFWSSEGIFSLAVWAWTLSVLHVFADPQRRRVLMTFALTACVAMVRPTAEYWLVPLIIMLWWRGVSWKWLGQSVLLYGLITLSAWSINYARQDVFGYTQKSGRMLFLRAWIRDRSVSPQNGEASKKLFALMEDRYSDITMRYPEGLKGLSTFKDLYNESLKRPQYPDYHYMYYLFVSELRHELGNKQADRLLRQVAVEAISKNRNRYLANSWHYFKANLGISLKQTRQFKEPRSDLDIKDGSREDQSRSWKFGWGPVKGMSHDKYTQIIDTMNQRANDMMPENRGVGPALKNLYQLWQLVMPSQRLIIWLSLVGCLTSVVAVFRRPVSPTAACTLVLAFVFLSHAAVMALFWGELEMHNIPLSVPEILVAAFPLTYFFKGDTKP